MNSDTIIPSSPTRRGMLGGLAAGTAVLALPGCASMGGFGFVDAIQRLLYLSSEGLSRECSRRTASGTSRLPRSALAMCWARAVMC